MRAVKAVCVAVEIGLFKSEVLSTFCKPKDVFVGISVIFNFVFIWDCAEDVKPDIYMKM